jgi:iron complex transport system ATP-binding protein
MMQREYLPFPFTATQVAALGRLPWNQSSESAEEQAIVQECLATAGAYHLARREYPGLSGGERARVQFARALAQIHGSDGKSRYLLLDEPTASLDFAFVHQCLDTVRAQTTRGIGALVILQDPALALRYADTVSLVERGRIIATGCAESIVTAEAIATLYGLGLDRVRMLSPAWPARS